MAYAENFHGGVSFSGIWLSFVFGVHCLWRHNLTSYSCFQSNVLAKFFDIISIFFYIHSPYFMCHCNEYKLLALQVRIPEQNILNATTQQFITAKIPGCALKQGVKHTHQCVRAICNYKMRLRLIRLCFVKYEQSSKEKVRAGLFDPHPSLPDRILLNYTRNEKVHKVRKKTFDFLLFIEVQQTYNFPFSLLRHQTPEFFCVNNCCFWARATVLLCYRN